MHFCCPHNKSLPQSLAKISRYLQSYHHLAMNVCNKAILALRTSDPEDQNDTRQDNGAAHASGVLWDHPLIYTRPLVAEYAAGRRVVLIFDEAQNLTRDVLEELRMFTNINSGKDELLQLMIIGQPELRDVVMRPDLKQFAQRVAASFHLPEMDQRDVAAFIAHRLQVAGRDTPIFDADAIAAIYEATRGVPRLVNQLCDLALVYAFTMDRQDVDARVIAQILKDGVFFGGGQLRDTASFVRTRVGAASPAPVTG